MKLGIDASNIRRGGGVTHLVELLGAADPAKHGFDEVIVWSGAATLAAIKDRPWLRKIHVPVLDGGLLARSLWQRNQLSDCARQTACDVLFVPGGSYAGDFAPMVTLSQNLLPFEWKELKRFGWSKMTVKLLLLRFTQSRTFRKAAGLIFLTRYAQAAVLSAIKKTSASMKIVPHGIEKRFSLAPRPQQAISSYSNQRPFKLVYVSILDVYKHQDQVAEAVSRLRGDGLPIEISFIGPAYPPAATRLKRVLDRLDPEREFIHVTGPIPYEALHSHYAQADLCVFASSCENLPIILLEGMAAGLPIACSKRGPMPEVLKEGGLYFNPEDPEDMYQTLKTMILDPALRTRLADKSWQETQAYSWRQCADQTFGFFANLVHRSHTIKDLS